MNNLGNKPVLGETDPDFGKIGLDNTEEASETVNDVDDEGGEDAVVLICNGDLLCDLSLCFL